MPILLVAIVMLVPAGQRPALAALYERGVAYDEFLANALAQRTLWLQNTGRASAAPDVIERLKKVSDGLKILVIAEPACSDSVNTLPYLAQLASQAGVELRIVNKATGQAVMEQHRTPDGRAATPTVILLRQGKEAGAWIERPSVLQTWYVGPGSKLSTQDRMTRKLAWYDWDRGDSTIEEIVTLAEKQ
jgi:thioredoxin family protein